MTWTRMSHPDFNTWGVIPATAGRRGEGESQNISFQLRISLLNRPRLPRERSGKQPALFQMERSGP